MGALPQMYICDYPGCTNQFVIDNGYSFPVNASMFGGAPGIAGFQCPQSQHICCSVQHAQQMIDYCYNNHLLPKLQADAQATGFTLQMTPPTA